MNTCAVSLLRHIPFGQLHNHPSPEPCRPEVFVLLVVPYHNGVLLLLFWCSVLGCRLYVSCTGGGAYGPLRGTACGACC